MTARRERVTILAFGRLEIVVNHLDLVEGVRKSTKTREKKYNYVQPPKPPGSIVVKINMD